MKKVLKEFLELFGNSLLVISLMLSSFLLLINLYHYNEINAVYDFNVRNNDQYNLFKETVEKIETNMKKINTDKIKDSGKRMTLKLTEGQITKCINMVKESALYNVEKTSFHEKDLYLFNEELFTNIQNQCLFMPNYTTMDSFNKYNIDSSNYQSIDKYVTNQQNYITAYSNFLKNEMLQNSSYYYVTDNTKSTIFNRAGYTAELIILNYNNMMDAVNMMAKWYVVEAGGSYE